MGILRTILNDTITGKKRHYTYCHILENEHYPFYVGIGTHVKKATKFSRAKSASGRNQEWHDKITGETLESFDTIRLAAISLNTESLNKDKPIGRVCKNGGIAYNYKWIYGN